MKLYGAIDLHSNNKNVRLGSNLLLTIAGRT